MNSTHAISISALTKVFPGKRSNFGVAEQVKALDGISLEVSHGEIVGLLGANGAGKTTLVDILATYLLPTSGEVRICNLDVIHQEREVRRIIGYAPASPDGFFPRLTVRQNLEFFAILYGLRSAAANSRIQELLELVGMNEFPSRNFQSLSLGMKQRLALARALLTDPPVLLLDEPTRSLDPAMQQEMYHLLSVYLRDSEGKTILLVTHSLQEAESVCNRVAVLSRGKLVAHGTVAQVQESAGAGSLAEAFKLLTEADRQAAEAEAASLGGSEFGI